MTFYEPAEAKIAAEDGKSIAAVVILVNWTPLNDKGDIAFLIVNEAFAWTASSNSPLRLRPEQVKWDAGNPKPEKD